MIAPSNKQRKSLSKGKIAHTITTPELLTTKYDWWESMAGEAFMFFPDKEKWRDRLRYTMLKYFENPQRIELDEFCIDHKLHPETLRLWRKNYPDLESTVRAIKIFIGVKRRLGVHTGKYNMASCYKDMHTLEPTWAEAVDKYHSELKKQEEQVARAYNVTMTPAEKPKDKE